MMHREETEESEMEGGEGCWKHISEDKKKAFMKAIVLNITNLIYRTGI
jgi:hypothetical protein